MTIQEIGEMLLLERRRRGLSQAQVSATSGVHPQSIGAIERGQSVTLRTLMALLVAYELVVVVRKGDE